MKNISEEKGWIIEHVGMSEWYIDAIIGYIAIHDNTYFSPSLENLNYFGLSNDSKKLISKSYVKKMNHSLKSSYINYSHKKYNNLFNIKDVNANNFPKNIDIFTYSFPCQDLSIQGLQKGFEKGKNTRSGLLWEIERLFLEINKFFKKTEMPKYLLMENVANILGKNNIGNYENWLNQLDKLGYESKTYLLNSQDFGSAQNRKRVFCLSIRKELKEKLKFSFKDIEKSKPNINLKDIIDIKDKNKSIDLSDYEVTKFKKTQNGVILKKIDNYTKFNSENYVYSVWGKGPTLTASGANSRIKIEFDNTVRYMSAKEAFLYMGFDLIDYLNIKKTNLISDNKIIFLAGNSISIEVLEAIFRTLEF